ncbi:MAG: NAD(+) synthase [Planctomycetaceae bacterium]|nr:NAD(+) synthase [Planctomycetaceae bacterium]
MKRIRLGAAVLNQTPLDWAGNADRIRQAIHRARERRIGVLCLPELCLTGYGCEDMFLSPHTWRSAWDSLHSILPVTEGMLVTLGLPLYVTNGVYNVVCVVADGQIAGFVPKQHLAGDGLHYEPRWFRAWPAEVVTTFHYEQQSWPIGDVQFECDGVRLGFEICEDAWVAGRPGNRMAECGVDVILNPSASHFAFGKHEIRKRFVLEGSRAFGVSYIYANLLGNEAGRAIYDGGALIASSGQLVAAGPRFGFHDVGITCADVDVDLTRTRRAGIHSMPTDVSDDVHARIIHVPGKLTAPDSGRTKTESATAILQASLPTASSTLVSATPESEHDEFTQAIALALFDYMRKSYSRGFVVSMSGGADSSAVACLIRCMAERAVAELTLEGVQKKLPWFAAVQNARSIDQLMHHLLTGVYQATRNSSDVTRNAAEAVTCGVGGTFHQLDVDSLVADYTSIVEAAIGRKLQWDRDDIALQNIQARTRSPGIWMFANLNNALLLSTSNRSEAAVGYATMDGDTSGGLSPIAGIDKAFLRDWLRTMEKNGSAGCAAIPALRLVNEQQPTAELRPAEYEQTDEGDLMPYPILDEIEGLAIGDKRSPAEVLFFLTEAHPEHSREQLVEWVKRFFRLWCRNQWKRERYAPSFHVDDKNLDPRTWCRFPILSGGYQAELNDLR